MMENKSNERNQLARKKSGWQEKKMHREGRSMLKGSTWIKGTQEVHSLQMRDCATSTPQLVLWAHVHTASGPDAGNLPILDRALLALLWTRRGKVSVCPIYWHYQTLPGKQPSSTAYEGIISEASIRRLKEQALRSHRSTLTQPQISTSWFYTSENLGRRMRN